MQSRGFPGLGLRTSTFSDLFIHVKKIKSKSIAMQNVVNQPRCLQSRICFVSWG